LDFYEDLCARPKPPVTGLLTGNIKQGARIKLERYNLWEKFPFGGFADDHEERPKIAVAALRRGSEHFGRDLKGEEVLVIGDTPLDIDCGRAIGAKVLAVATGRRLPERASAAPTGLGRPRPDAYIRRTVFGLACLTVFQRKLSV
jgi:phosphoglycolate phosphatase-like HAD superfamily hydrolase